MSSTIVFTADRNYLLPLAVAGRSVIDNGGLNPLRIVVLGIELIAEDKRRLRRSWRAADVAVDFYDVDSAILSGLPTPGYLPLATYARLLAPRLLPSELSERFIYMDCDTLTIGTLRDLADTHFPDPVAAVQSPFRPHVSSPGAIATWKDEGLAEKTPYFNDGVMVVDRARWLDSNLETLSLDYARRNASTIRMHGQEALNAVLGGNWSPVHARFNVMHRCSDIEAQRLIGTHPSVIHFSGRSKPWNSRFDRSRAGTESFYDTLRRTDWHSYADELSSASK